MWTSRLLVRALLLLVLVLVLVLVLLLLLLTGPCALPAEHCERHKPRLATKALKCRASPPNLRSDRISPPEC